MHDDRERIDLVPRLVLQLREREEFIGLLMAHAGRQAEITPVDEEVLARVELAVEVVLLRDDAEVGADLSAHGSEPVDAAGFVVAPGFVDMHCHLREPGHEYKETIATGTRAAALGGFTAVAPMANTEPVNDNAAVTAFILDRARREGAARVLPVGAVTKGLLGRELTQMGELKAAGCVALSDDGHAVSTARMMRLALQYASQFGLLVIDHCEEPTLTQGGAMNEGVLSTMLGLAGIPGAAEEIIVARDIALAASLCLVGVKQRWRMHWATAGAARV